MKKSTNRWVALNGNVGVVTSRDMFTIDESEEEVVVLTSNKEAVPKEEGGYSIAALWDMVADPEEGIDTDEVYDLEIAE